MNYQLHNAQTSSPHRTILTRTTNFQHTLSYVFRGIAMLAWVVALGSYLSAGQWLPPTLAQWAAGGGCLAWATSLLTMRPWHMPNRFVFDNQRGVLIMEGEDNQGKPLEASLPYQDIRSFRTRRIDRQDRSGRLRHYDVEMNKRDGAFWTLHRTQTLEEAEAFCEQLERHVDLSGTPHIAEEALSSAGQIEIIEASESTVLTWRERTPIRYGLLCIWSNLGLALCLLPLHHYIEPLLWQISLGCLGLFTLFGISFVLLSLQHRHTITITDTELTYSLPHPSLEVDHFCIAAKDIHTVLFNFSLEPKASQLYVLRSGETMSLLQHKRGQAGLGRQDTLTKLLRRLHKIDAKELSFAEQLHLEYALQQIIQRRCGHEVA